MADYDFLDDEEKAEIEKKYKQDYIDEMKFQDFDLNQSSPDLAPEVRDRLSYQARRYSTDGVSDARRNRLEIESQVKTENDQLRAQGGGHMGALLDHIDKDGPDRDVEGRPIGKASKRMLREALKSDRTVTNWQPGNE